MYQSFLKNHSQLSYCSLEIVYAVKDYDPCGALLFMKPRFNSFITGDDVFLLLILNFFQAHSNLLERNIHIIILFILSFGDQSKVLMSRTDLTAG